MGNTTSANLLSSSHRASPEAAPSALGHWSRQMLAHPITACPPHYCLPTPLLPTLLLPTHPVIAHLLLTCPPIFPAASLSSWRQGAAFSPCTQIFDTGGALLACRAPTALLQYQELVAGSGESTGAALTAAGGRRGVLRQPGKEK